MINIENNNNDEPSVEPTAPTDTVKVQVDAHIMIKDLDTQEVLVNQRG
jgi:hypothetical protein